MGAVETALQKANVTAHGGFMVNNLLAASTVSRDRRIPSVGTNVNRPPMWQIQLWSSGGTGLRV